MSDKERLQVTKHKTEPKNMHQGWKVVYLTCFGKIIWRIYLRCHCDKPLITTLSFEMMCVKGVCYYTWSDLSIVCSDQGLMLKISALKFFLVANLSTHLLSTQFRIPYYLVILSHQCSTTVSLETYPLYSWSISSSSQTE